MDKPPELNMYEIKEVGSDFIIVTDHAVNIKVTFADRDDMPPTKEEEAAFFWGVQRLIGLKAPVCSSHLEQNLDIFLDHRVDLFGTLRSIPFPFRVQHIDVTH